MVRTLVNSSPPSAACMRQWIESALVQIMACRGPLCKPMLGNCQLEPWEQTSVKFQSRYKIFDSRNYSENIVCEMARPKYMESLLEFEISQLALYVGIVMFLFRNLTYSHYHSLLDWSLVMHCSGTECNILLLKLTKKLYIISLDFRICNFSSMGIFLLSDLFESTGLNVFGRDCFVPHLHSQLGWSAGYFGLCHWLSLWINHLYPVCWFTILEILF